MKLFDSSCTRCSLSKRPRRLGLGVCIPSSGPEQSDILFFGEAPGEIEEQENGPFKGSAGRELDGLLELAGLNRDEVRVSNPVRCRPPENRKPTPDEVAACSYYTIRELAAVQPKVVVALGGSALKALVGTDVVGKSRGKMLSLLPQYRCEVPVIATYHPAAYLHNPAKREEYRASIVNDMKLAQRVIDEDAESGATIITSFSSERLIKYGLRKLAKCDEIACDLEWEVIPATKKEPKGMWPWSKRRGKLPRAFSLAVAGRVDGDLLSVSLPFDHDLIPLVRKLVARIPTIGHNYMSDMIWMFSMGWRVKPKGDTMLLASLLNMDVSMSLQALASLMTVMVPNWKQATVATIGRMPQTDEQWADLLERGGGDAVATLLLHDALLAKVAADGRKKLLRLYRHVLVPAAENLARAALNGVPIDEERLEAFETRLLARQAALVQEVGDALKLPGNYATFLSLGNEHKLAPYIQRAIGERLPTTDSGKPSVTNDILLLNKDKHPAMPKTIRIRKLDARNARYYRPWRWMLKTQEDRRLHTVYRLTVAGTGRTSAEGEIGNTFQQFPRRAAVRGIVKAGKDKLIGNVDQGTIEMRAAAWLAQEPTMLRFFRERVDVHRATAGYMKALERGWTQTKYLKSIDEEMLKVTTEERYGAKAPNFGLLFGGTYKVLIRSARQTYGLTWSREKAQTAVDAFFSLYPDLVPWHESFWRDVERGWGETLTGRRRTVEDDGEGPEGLLRKYINLPVQNFASDLSLLCMNYTFELARAEYGRHWEQVIENIGFFHDASLLHFEASEEKAISEIVVQAWEHPPLDRLRINFDVPLEAEFKVGKRWVA